MARTIQSPGVEINEIDLTLRSDTNVGTNVFITGFSNQGPIDEVLQPTTISEFEEIYGRPTNSAENYFYHTVKSVLNSSPARAIVTRLPYGENKGEGFSDWKYSALAYPVSPIDTWFYTTSAYTLQSIVVTNSGSGYSRLPRVLTDFGYSYLTTYEVITADDFLGNDTFGISAIKILTNESEFSVPPSILSEIDSFVLTSLNIANSGWGYLDPNISFEVVSEPGDYYERAAVVDIQMGVSNLSSFEIKGATIVSSNSGSGYISAPSIIVLGTPSVSAATFIANMVPDGKGNFGVGSITLVERGLGYNEVPSLSFSAPQISYGTTPVASVSADSTKTYGVTSVEVLDYGRGYDHIPNIVIHDRTVGEASTVIFDGYEGTFLAYTDGLQEKTERIGEHVAYGETIDSRNSLKYIDDVDYSRIGFDNTFIGKTYFIGKPTHLELTADEYENIKSGYLNWTNNPPISTNGLDYNSLGNSAFIILNKSQTALNHHYEGYYVGVMDNSNNNTATLYNGILHVDALQESYANTNTYNRIPNTRLNFSLSADSFGAGNSISEIMENLSEFDLGSNTFDDFSSIALFRINKDRFISNDESIALNFALKEKYVGSLIYDREIPDKNGGLAKNISLETITNPSNNISILINPYISNRNGAYTASKYPNPKIRFLTSQLLDDVRIQGFFDNEFTYATRVGANSATVDTLMHEFGFGKVDSLFPLGVYTENGSDRHTKKIGNLPKKIERAFELVENSDVYPIDLAVEGGLGTIYVNAVNQEVTESGSAGEFSDIVPLKSLSSFYVTNYDSLDEAGTTLRSTYNAVANVFISVAEKQRKDFLTILDPIRNIFVQGANNKIINSKKIWSPNAGQEGNVFASGYTVSNFSQHIYWPLRHQFGTINCSYATTYANWAQISDNDSGTQIWVPFSGIAAGIMANTDANFQPWYAPAGFTRGVVTGVNDIAIYPKQKQRDQLYKISLNPVTFFPNEGFTIFGQKTLLKRPSAFDRINVRRLFLALEKATKDTAKFFVFEPNTLFTRTQVINVLAPIFENAKNTEGLYDYRIICDERNNTPSVIDNNELKIDIYIQPVRTAEFILVNFYATRTGTNFDELIGS